MDFTEFTRRLADGPPPIAVFVGDERFLHREALSALRTALDGPAVVRLPGAEATPARVTDECYAAGLFAPRQVVVLDDADQFVAHWPETPKAWLAEPPTAAWLCLQAPKPKPRRKAEEAGGKSEPDAERPVSIVEAFPAKPTKACWVVRCDPPDAAEIPGWAGTLAKRAGKSLERAAAAAVAAACDRSLDALEALILACAAHAGSKKTIGAEDVTALVEGGPDPEAFALTNAIAGGRTKEAFVLLKRLIAARENEQRLLGLLNWQAWQVYRVRRALDAGTPQGSIPAAIGAKYVHPAVYGQARQATAAQWRGLIAALAECDRAMKTSSLDPALVLEMGILRGLRPALAVAESSAW